MADGVDQKVRMDVRLIDMRCDQHLAVRPGPGGELICQFVCLLWSDVLIRMEGLRVVIKPDGTFLVVRFPCGDEFVESHLRRAVDPADEVLTIIHQRLLILLHIGHHIFENSNALRIVVNKIDRCHISAALDPRVYTGQYSFSPVRRIRCPNQRLRYGPHVQGWSAD